MQPTLCYVTPSHAGDIERFALLRYSMSLFSPNIKHFVLLDAEDVPLFRKRFQNEENLEFISSDEVLPKKLEQRRKQSRSLYGSVIKSLAWRLGLAPDRLNGWRLQQLLKIYFLNQTDFDAAVFLDSDIIFCARVETDYFLKNNSLCLLQTSAKNIEDYAFEICTHTILRTDMGSEVKYFNYIHQAPRFYKSTAQALVAELIKINGDDWAGRFIEQPFPSEYSMLGYSARVLQRYQHFEILAGQPDDWAYRIQFGSDRDRLDETFNICKIERGQRKFMLIQSNLNIPVNQYQNRVKSLIHSIHSDC